jgi:hypothetical protein
MRSPANIDVDDDADVIFPLVVVVVAADEYSRSRADCSN